MFGYGFACGSSGVWRSLTGYSRRRVRRLCGVNRGRHKPRESAEIFLELALPIGERGLFGEQRVIRNLQGGKPAPIFFTLCDARLPAGNFFFLPADFFAQRLLGFLSFGQTLAQRLRLGEHILIGKQPPFELGDALL